jgi:CobQ/CobB/MinD/ParA nucleotide binding domain
MASSKSPPESTATLPLYINLIGSNKGGVGKSFICRIIFHNILDQELSVIPFDADTSTHDFSDIYDEVPESNVLGFNVDEAIDYLNPVINTVVRNKSNLLVNMPSNIDQIFERWFIDNDIAELLKENNCQMRIWYVTTGEYDSYMNLFVNLKKYGDVLSHVVVKNNISSRTNWQEFDDHTELQALIKKYACPVVEIPYLHLSLDKMNLFRSRRLKWSQILTVQDDDFGIIEHSRIRKVLKSCADQVKSLGLI